MKNAVKRRENERLDRKTRFWGFSAVTYPINAACRFSLIYGRPFAFFDFIGCGHSSRLIFLFAVSVCPRLIFLFAVKVLSVTFILFAAGVRSRFLFLSIVNVYPRFTFYRLWAVDRRRGSFRRLFFLSTGTASFSAKIIDALFTASLLRWPHFSLSLSTQQIKRCFFIQIPLSIIVSSYNFLAPRKKDLKRA